MTPALITLSYWLHSLATVILVGNFLLLSLIYLPTFARNQADPTSVAILSESSSRSRKWLYAALVIYIITGIYLTDIDPNYLGLAKFTNLWSILMLVKHILVVGMVAIGFWYNAILRIGPQLKANIETPRILSQFSMYSWLMAIIGIVVLLLTAISQAL